MTWGYANCHSIQVFSLSGKLPILQVQGQLTGETTGRDQTGRGLVAN